MRASVVVPVYNPGRHLDRCIESILAQSLPRDAYEVVFVDDGSTDGSGRRLDAVAVANPMVSVVHQPNSGWPGRPRNVGLDRARGIWVYFLDHDDALAPDALERLTAYGDASGSDIVIGGMVGHGRPVPRALFRETKPRCTPWDAPLLTSLTPHKLFRRAFLEAHAIRFPEGRRRLEDHVFVLRAYFAADVISVLAGPPCYHLHDRGDAGNASTSWSSPALYNAGVRECLEIIEANTEAGPRRDQLVRRYARAELLNQVTGSRFLGLPRAEKLVLVEAAGAVARDHVTPGVDPLLEPLQRLQLDLLRAGDVDGLVAVAALLKDIRAEVVDRSVRLSAGSVLEAEVALVDPRGAMHLVADGSTTRLTVDGCGSAARGASPVAVELPCPPPGGSTSVVARSPVRHTEIPLPAEASRQVVTADPRAAIVDTLHVGVDLDALRRVTPADGGTWEVIARTRSLGVERETAVAAVRVGRDGSVSVVPARRAALGARARSAALGVVEAVSRRTGPRVRRRVGRLAAMLVKRID